MTTLGASMVTLLTDNWAGAGAAPTFGFLIDYQKDLADTTEQVLVRLPIHEDITPINDTYSNFKYTIQIRVKTTTSEDRLKVLTDETIRIINTYAITNITRQFAKRGENTSDRTRQVFSYDVWAIYEEHMSTGGTSYSSPGAGDVAFPADVTIAGTLGVTGDATVANLITAGDVDGVDVSEEPARITAEIAAAVQAEDTLAEMNDVDLTGLSDDDIIVYDLGTTTWKPEAPAAAYTDADAIAAVVAENPLALTNDLTVTGNDIAGSAGTAITMNATGVEFQGTIGVNSTAPSADYSFLDYSAGHKQFHLRSSDQTATMMMSGATGKDSSMTLREGTTQKAQFQYDASDNDSRFKSVPSGHGITLPDGGGIEFVGAVAMTLAEVQDLLMFGSANAAWVPCIQSGVTTTVGVRQYLSNYTYTNIDGTDFGSQWECPLPTNKGALSLHVSQVRVIINDADDAAYVDHVYVKGLKSDGSIAAIADDGTNLTSTGSHDYDFADVDVTLREQVRVYLTHVVDAAGELDVGGVFLHCYYDT